jgi:DNA-binding transcriptional LysR family regulator
MFIDSLNLNHFRIFESVYRSRSMTVAARELHMTQSGVSQHIKSLEDMLRVRLFDRIKQRLVPTSEGNLLYRQCSESLRGIEHALEQIKEDGKQLFGTVSVGTPIEFGNSLVLPSLAEFGAKNPLVKFKVDLGYASAMNEMILKGELDFAFIDEFRMDRLITTEKVYDETLELCASHEFIKRKGMPKDLRKMSPKAAREFYESLDYIEYQDDEPILKMWFGHHLEGKHHRLNLRATVMDVQGVARLIEAGMGAGVLPGHLVAKLQEQGHKLHCFPGSGKPLKNTISIAYLRERTQTPAARAAMAFLRTSLKASLTSASRRDGGSVSSYYE